MSSARSADRYSAAIERMNDLIGNTPQPLRSSIYDAIAANLHAYGYTSRYGENAVETLLRLTVQRRTPTELIRFTDALVASLPRQ